MEACYQMGKYRLEHPERTGLKHVQLPEKTRGDGKPNYPTFLVRAMDSETVGTQDRINKVTALAEKARAELAKAKDLEPSERPDFRQSVARAFVTRVEKLKAERVGELVQGLDRRRSFWEKRELYTDPAMVVSEALRLEQAKLKVHTMTAEQASAEIARARRTGIYDEIELLALASHPGTVPRADPLNPSKTQPQPIGIAVGRLLEEQPPWISSPEAKAELDELKVLNSARLGSFTYQLKDQEIWRTQDALQFLNEPPVDPSDDSAQRARDEVIKKALETA